MISEMVRLVLALSLREEEKGALRKKPPQYKKHDDGVVLYTLPGSDDVLIDAGFGKLISPRAALREFVGGEPKEERAAIRVYALTKELLSPELKKAFEGAER